MCVDPLKRATLEEILDHEWIKSDVHMRRKADAMMEQAMPMTEKRSTTRDPEDDHTNTSSCKKLKTSYSDSTDKSNE